MSPHARDEWDRALRCIDAAEALLGLGDHDGCASRAYYGAFHAVTAFFLLDGREFGRHSAVEAAVHRELVHSGRVDREFGAAYTSLQRLRTVGDYGMGEHVSQNDARASIDRARAIVGDVRELAGGKLP